MIYYLGRSHGGARPLRVRPDTAPDRRGADRAHRARTEPSEPWRSRQERLRGEGCRPISRGRSAENIILTGRPSSARTEIAGALRD